MLEISISTQSLTYTVASLNSFRNIYQKMGFRVAKIVFGTTYEIYHHVI